MPEIVDAPPETLSPDGKLFKDRLAAEVFNLRVRRDAKKAIEQEEREALAGASKEGLQLIYDPLPTETPELIPGLLPESGAMAIVAETNVGKSLVLCEIGSALLTGELLWDSIRPNRTVEKIVYVLGEHTAAVIQGLFHRTQLPHAGEFRLVDPAGLHPYKALVVNGQQQLLAIDQMLRLTEGAGLITFDPLAGFVQGNNAENDNSSMRTLIDIMSFIAEKHKAACLIAAHQGKPRMDDSGQEIRRTVYATRGASAVEDSLTTIFYMKRSLAVKQQQHAGERFELIARKRKGIAETEVFKLQRDPNTLRHSLLNPTSTRSSAPTVEERLILASKVQRLLEANPKFTADTAMELTANMEGMSVETVKRWLTSVQ